ncbi:hypothetical protein IV203_014883 [Nitzschia inconspicua]|uniref:tRNA (guanine(9)-N(1))-methyltransferase n=1 Tax=Nitzschia inconspicua TaxID=303405 RepID=A0A9K3L9Q8_9STRA|nr:hypothetical protein IV203_020431 [Nitzschia inconspicua]KAG7358295.1 hypothetical protein IV203_014883 [Nitzschia inconspicua]
MLIKEIIEKVNDDLVKDDNALSTTDPNQDAVPEINELGTRLQNEVSIHGEFPPNILVCDAGYGFPRENRPFQEKLKAISNQLANFLQWQMEEDRSASNDRSFARIQVVGCSNERTRLDLQEKLLEKLHSSTLPSHVEITCQSLEDFLSSGPAVSSNNDEPVPVYLSPDADETLDPQMKPPRVVVIGLLIDRRIQPNRSKDRASKLHIVSKRWPLEECFLEISANEPLNVDCILEGMQQWWWNCGNAEAVGSKENFIQAASQAINHHAQRHPSRPLHIPGSNNHDDV